MLMEENDIIIKDVSKGIREKIIISFGWKN